MNSFLTPILAVEWLAYASAGTLALLITTLMLLSKFTAISPHKRILRLAILPAILSLGVVFVPWVWPLVLAIDGVLVLIVVIDLFSLAGQKSFEVERKIGLIASLEKPHPVEIVVTNRSQQEQPIRLRDGLPDGLIGDPDEFGTVLPPMSRATWKYNLTAHRRGSFQLKQIDIRVRSQWRFWHRQLTLPLESSLNVYPNMKQLSEYALLARTNRLSLMGVRRTRRIGQDNEFERLRDYTPDDDFRHIDWRSTARRQKLTVKDFQANQSQRLMFMIDCGRMMTGTSNGVSLLDHALNAMLMLSYVALQKGDQVGFMCFSDTVHTFVPPKGGMKHMNQLLHASFDRFPTMVESRYSEAFMHMATHVRKRAMLVLVTNVIDEVNAQQIDQHLSMLAGRHLPLGVLLRDHALFDAIDKHNENPTETGDDFYRAAAAAEILTWRHHILADLETKGVLSMDVFPEDLVAPLVNRYLDVKARHLL